MIKIHFSRCTTFIAFFLSPLLASFSQSHEFQLLTEHGAKIQHARVSFPEHQDGTYSDVNGVFFARHLDSATISHLGYNTINLRLDSSQTKISMQQREITLENLTIVSKGAGYKEIGKINGKKTKIVFRLSSIELGKRIVIEEDLFVHALVLPFVASKEYIADIKLNLYLVENGLPSRIIHAQHFRININDQRKEIISIPNRPIPVEASSELFASLEVMGYEKQGENFISINMNESPFEAFLVKVNKHNMLATRNFLNPKVWHSTISPDQSDQELLIYLRTKK